MAAAVPKKRSSSISLAQNESVFVKNHTATSATAATESSSGSEDSSAYAMEPLSRQVKSRVSARRCKSERLTGAKPRVKRRDALPPLSMTRAISGADVNVNVNVNVTPDMSPSLLRRATINAGPRASAASRVKRDSPLAHRVVRGVETSAHRRAASVRVYGTAAPLCGSGPLRRSTFLDVPDDVDNNVDDEDSYRIRSFDTTRKGVVNRGDSFRRRRSRSNSLAPHPHDAPLNGITLTAASTAPSSALLALDSPASDSYPADDDHHTGNTRSYRSAMIGAHGVGKSALVGQFMTSECINAYCERVRNEESGSTESVFVMLNGEESEIVFSYFSNLKMEMNRNELPDAYIVVYSVIDKSSFQRAEDELARLQNWDALRGRALIVVGNKIDLARSRAVSTQDGKCLACAYRAKFMEISVVINHNVDELLVGILTQIRLKEELQKEMSEGVVPSVEPSNGQGSHSWIRNKGLVRASMKAKQMFTWLFGKDDDQYNNCENFQIL